jgi:hypothetical protein
MPGTVLLLGSGASRASRFALPTMAGFFTGDQSLPSNLDDFLSWFYPGRPRDSYNLEEVLAYLDIARARLPLWGLRDPITQQFDKEELYTSLLEYVKTRLAIPSDGLCPLHQQLVSSLQERDTIITLNYDLVVDRVLRKREHIADGPGHPGFGRLGKLPGLVGYTMLGMYLGPTLHRQEMEKGFYLKLHGSLDWLYCMTPGCQNNTSIILLVCSRPRRPSTRDLVATVALHSSRMSSRLWLPSVSKIEVAWPSSGSPTPGHCHHDGSMITDMVSLHGGVEQFWGPTLAERT